MTVEWHQPVSTNISRIGHDPMYDQMLVEWRDGKISVYDGVSPEKFNLVRKSPSVTQAINTEVKPSHSHRYLPKK